jgi:hypothetical protein
MIVCHKNTSAPDADRRTAEAGLRRQIILLWLREAVFGIWCFVPSAWFRSSSLAGLHLQVFNAATYYLQHYLQTCGIASLFEALFTGPFRRFLGTYHSAVEKEPTGFLALLPM